jgi:hypothetical protein
MLDTTDFPQAGTITRSYTLNRFPTAGVFTNPFFVVSPYQHDFKKIRGFADIPENWDGLGSSAPTDLAIENALFIVTKLFEQGISPDSINPTSDDSIVIQLYRPSLVRLADSKHFYLFECFNNGDIVFLKKENGQRDVVDLSKWDVPSAVTQISSDKTNALF